MRTHTLLLAGLLLVLFSGPSSAGSELPPLDELVERVGGSGPLRLNEDEFEALARRARGGDAHAAYQVARIQITQRRIPPPEGAPRIPEPPPRPAKSGRSRAKPYVPPLPLFPWRFHVNSRYAPGEGRKTMLWASLHGSLEAALWLVHEARKRAREPSPSFVTWDTCLERSPGPVGWVEDLRYGAQSLGHSLSSSRWSRKARAYERRARKLLEEGAKIGPLPPALSEPEFLKPRSSSPLSSRLRRNRREGPRGTIRAPEWNDPAHWADPVEAP